jgi:hypothetical protein
MAEALDPAVGASALPTHMANESTILFTVGVTDLRVLAEEKGLHYEADAAEERVLNQDGIVIIRVPVKPPNMRGPKRKDPTVWMRSVRFHTYYGKPQNEGEIYLCHEDDVENILNLGFARREPAPRRAVRRNPPPPKTDVGGLVKKGI